MLGLLFTVALSSDQTAIEKYLARVVPKALYFEQFSAPLKLDAYGNRNGVLSASATIGSRKVTAEFKESGSSYEIIYVEADDNDGWKYQRASKQDDDVASHYLKMMINSIVEPNLVRSTSHRLKEIDGEMHHQMTLILEIAGKETLQFIEWKFIKNNTKHTFVNHHVIVRDGDEI